jgi:DNA (cytosine-5)-methyltransferase 1
MPDLRDAERLQGFPTDWTKPAERVGRTGRRWKLVGNAVSVPAAEWIGRRMADPGVPLDYPITSIRGTRWPAAAWNMGPGRVGVEASEWPVRRDYKSLADFLQHPPRPLSIKATSGFLERTKRSSLKFPPGFLEALRAHVARMMKSESNSISPCLTPSTANAG